MKTKIRQLLPIPVMIAGLLFPRSVGATGGYVFDSPRPAAPTGNGYVFDSPPQGTSGGYVFDYPVSNSPNTSQTQYGANGMSSRSYRHRNVRQRDQYAANTGRTVAKRAELTDTSNGAHVGYATITRNGRDIVLDYDFDNDPGCRVKRIVAETRDAGSETDIRLDDASPEYRDGTYYATARDAVLKTADNADANGVSYVATTVWFDCRGTETTAQLRARNGTRPFIAFTPYARRNDDCDIAGN